MWLFFLLKGKMYKVMDQKKKRAMNITKGCAPGNHHSHGCSSFLLNTGVKVVGDTRHVVQMP